MAQVNSMKINIALVKVKQRYAVQLSPESIHKLLPRLSNDTTMTDRIVNACHKKNPAEKPPDLFKLQNVLYQKPSPTAKPFAMPGKTSTAVAAPVVRLIW